MVFGSKGVGGIIGSGLIRNGFGLLAIGRVYGYSLVILTKTPLPNPY